MLVLAIIGSGGIFTGTNPSYTAAELTHHIKTAKCKYVLSEPDILQPVLEAAKNNNIPNEHVWIFDPLSRDSFQGEHRSWRELLDHGEDNWVRFDDLKVAESTCAARLFSSGTTGLPKAVTITHHNLVAQNELVFEEDPRPYPVRTHSPSFRC